MAFDNDTFNDIIREPYVTNNSGGGENIAVPDVVKNRFNWGAFLLHWIWGIGNKTYIACVVLAIALIPFIGGLASFCFCVWLGIKGNEWAWQNKHFSDIEAFHENQRKWAVAGVIILILSILLSIFVVGFYMKNSANEITVAQHRTMTLKNINSLQEAIAMNEALEVKCDFSSEGLAACFLKRMPLATKEGNTLKDNNGSVWTFNGNGICEYEEDNCYVKIDMTAGKTVESVTIPLYADENQYVFVDEDDINQYMQ